MNKSHMIYNNPSYTMQPQLNPKNSADLLYLENAAQTSVLKWRGTVLEPRKDEISNWNSLGIVPMY